MAQEGEEVEGEEGVDSPKSTLQKPNKHTNEHRYPEILSENIHQGCYLGTHCWTPDRFLLGNQYLHHKKRCYCYKFQTAYPMFHKLLHYWYRSEPTLHLKINI